MMQYRLTFAYKFTNNFKAKEGNLVLFNNDKQEFSIPAISGKWGKGGLPDGVYHAKYPREILDKVAFMQHDYGWGIFLEPKFKTDRTELMIHPDGNIPGTLGCIGLNFTTYQDNKETYVMLSEIIDRQGYIPTTIYMENK